MDSRAEKKDGAVNGWRLGAALMVGGLVGLLHANLYANEAEVKEISGMSIIGNDEAPKSLFIVPWKTSEIGSDTSLRSGLLDDSMRPVDREVFMREIDFYDISRAN
jgi:hypothetical protein